MALLFALTSHSIQVPAGVTPKVTTQCRRFVLALVLPKSLHVTDRQRFAPSMKLSSRWHT